MIAVPLGFGKAEPLPDMLAALDALLLDMVRQATPPPLHVPMFVVIDDSPESSQCQCDDCVIERGKARRSNVSTATQKKVAKYADERGWDELGSGINGTVFATPCGEWVYKRARRSDGTRTFLEWCLWKQRIGERMKGMPEVEFLVDCGDGGYVVGMRRYAMTAYAHHDNNYTDAYHHEDYVQALLAEWQMDCPGTQADDLHSKNVMWDTREGVYVVIDPSNYEYTAPGEPPEHFVLTFQ